MAFGKKTEAVAVIKAPNIVRAVVKIEGTAPYVQHRFSKKGAMMEKMATPAAQQKGKKDREVRDYDAEMRDAQHVSQEGWNGIPCPAFRAAMIDACRTVKLEMTRAKMAVFILPDGFDAADGTPLVKLIADKPERLDLPARNDNGAVDIRTRPMWRKWGANVQVEFDADMISAESIVNLLSRAGRQVGVGEGRPFSKKSCGQGWGTFSVVNAEAAS